MVQLELQALLLELRWRPTKVRHHSSAWLILVHSHTSIAPLGKRRSSPRKLNALLRRNNPLRLAGNCRPVAAYVRSMCGPRITLLTGPPASSSASGQGLVGTPEECASVCHGPNVAGRT
jgi:hypothetical protein